MHRAALAYLSDMTLLDTVLVAHGYSISGGKFQLGEPRSRALVASARSAPTNGCSMSQDSPSAQGARGLTRGLLYTRGGALAASVAQEGLAWRRRPEPQLINFLGACNLITMCIRRERLSRRSPFRRH